jgi:hypothetical protein
MGGRLAEVAGEADDRAATDAPAPRSCLKVTTSLLLKLSMLIPFTFPCPSTSAANASGVSAMPLGSALGK